MNRIAPTDQIKTFIPLPQAIETYTGEQFVKNKMRCPIHNEKTASFTVYPDTNTFYCFGCGVSGSLIDFVMLYFNLNFKEAIQRIDNDFNLGLTRVPKFSEYRKQQKELERRRAEREQQEEQEKKLNTAYWEAFDNVLMYEQTIKLYRPASSEDEPHPLFIEALQNIEYARHVLECAENKRRLIKK